MTLPIHFLSNSRGEFAEWSRGTHQRWLTNGEVYELIHRWMNKFYCKECKSVSNITPTFDTRFGNDLKCERCGNVGLELFIDEYDAPCFSKHNEHLEIVPSNTRALAQVICYASPGANEADHAYLGIAWVRHDQPYSEVINFTNIYRLKTWRGLEGAKVAVSHLMKGCGLE